MLTDQVVESKLKKLLFLSLNVYWCSVLSVANTNTTEMSFIIEVVQPNSLFIGHVGPEKWVLPHGSEDQ